MNGFAVRAHAGVQAGGDFYLCPLPAVQVPPALLDQYLRAARASGLPTPVERTQADGALERIADERLHRCRLTGEMRPA